MALPTDDLVAKINANLNTIGLFTGDSTCQGYGDGGGDPYDNGTFPGGFAPAGLPMRFGAFVGQKFDINARHGNGGALVNTSTRSGAPTFTTYNAGVGGTTIGYALSAINSFGLTPDIVFVRDGINDANGGVNGPTFQSQYQTLFNAAFAKWPDTTIVMLNNMVGYSSPGSVGIQNYVFNAHVGQNPPLDPAIRQSTLDPRVWAFDIRQAIAALSPFSSGMNDTLHPNTIGYRAEARFAVDTLFTDPLLTRPPTILTAELDPMTRGLFFDQTIEVLGFVSSIEKVAGDLPQGISLDEETGRLFGYPLGFSEDYTFTLRAINDNGSHDMPYTGTVHSNVLPFVYRTVPKVKWKAPNGRLYDARGVYVKTPDGSLKKAMLKS